ncbi:uncharacterized protein F5891DRAFT_912018, partial [Suillus fuscotomentosus]
RECYGAGLLPFHIFCDERAIPEAQRCSVADTRTILTFITSCTSSYAGGTLANYVYTIWAWHTFYMNSLGVSS